MAHPAGRKTLAVAMLPDDPGHPAGWIVDSRSLKPGNHIPLHALEGKDSRALQPYPGR